MNLDRHQPSAEPWYLHYPLSSFLALILAGVVTVALWTLLVILAKPAMPGQLADAPARGAGGVGGGANVPPEVFRGFSVTGWRSIPPPLRQSSTRPSWCPVQTPPAGRRTAIRCRRPRYCEKCGEALAKVVYKEIGKNSVEH